MGIDQGDLQAPRLSRQSYEHARGACAQDGYIGIHCTALFLKEPRISSTREVASFEREANDASSQFTDSGAKASHRWFGKRVGGQRWFTPT
jgi:hypothetical protein